MTWHLGDQFLTPGLEALEEEDAEYLEETEDRVPSAQFVAHSLEYGEEDIVTARLTVNYLTRQVDTKYSSRLFL